MQLKLLSSLIVFLGSYFPLSLILLVQDLDLGKAQGSLCWPYNNDNCFIPFNAPILSFTAVVVSGASFILALFILKSIRCKHQAKIVEANHVPSDLMNYVIPYVVSFISLSYADVKSVLGFGLFLLWIFWISHKSGRVILNPMLIVMGWRFYEVAYTTELGRIAKKGYMLSNGHLEPGSFVKYKKIQEVMIHKGIVND